MLRKKKLYLYLIASSINKNKAHTYIGCTSNFRKRLDQHNGLIHGGPRITKKNNNMWVPLMIVVIPRSFTISSKQIKHSWKSKSRGIVSRLFTGIKIANRYAFQRFYSDFLVDKAANRFHHDVKQRINTFCQQKKNEKKMEMRKKNINA